MRYARALWNKPPLGALPDLSHPLVPDSAFLFNEGAGKTLVNLIQPVTGTIQTTNFAWRGTRKLTGPGLEWTAIDQHADLGADNRILPTQGCTIILHYRKTDGTNRDSAAFGVNSSTVGDRCGVHLPFSDGVVYWDFGGATEDATRESVSGLTFGDDVWAFTTGSRGMEIWQNASKRSSNTANPTRNSTTNQFTLGKHGSTTAKSDTAEHGFLFIYKRQLSEADIIAVTLDPFAWVLQPSTKRFFHIAGLIVAPDGVASAEAFGAPTVSHNAGAPGNTVILAVASTRRRASVKRTRVGISLQPTATRARVS